MSNSRHCNKDCKAEGSKFVCGSDTNLYRNLCEMKKANCGKHVHQVCSVYLYWSQSQQDKDLQSLRLKIS